MNSPTLRFTLRNIAGETALGFHWFSKAASWSNAAIRPDTRICIEGFPRCGNTFAWAAFAYAQPTTGDRMAHHSHLARQVKLAVNYRVPVLLLIRNPLDAVSSLLIRKQGLSPEFALAYYQRFHERTLPYLDHMVVSDFPETTQSLGHVIQAVNQAFDTSFTPYEHSPENREAVFKLIEQADLSDRKATGVSEEQVARPSDARTEKKQDWKQILTSAKHQKLLSSCTGLYETFKQAAVTT